MPDIKRIYRQSLPKIKLIGKCYFEEEKENETFALKRREWFENDCFSPLKTDDSTA